MAAVAQSRIQDDVHPLLRHPRPIKRDTAKAQRMLGLIADSEEKLKELHREKSVTTKWLERPMYEHVDDSDLDSEKKEVGSSVEPQRAAHHAKEEADESDTDLLDRWTNPNRPTSIDTKSIQPLKTTLDVSFPANRPHTLNDPRPVSYHTQRFLSPEWTASPSTISPDTPTQRPISACLDPNRTSSIASSSGSIDSDPRSLRQQPHTWAHSASQAPTTRMRAERPASFQPKSSQSLSNLQSPQRPRPTSFATYHQKNRSGSKIASSRGLRNNTYPNFTRPQAGVAAKAIPGECMENDVVCQRFADDEVGPPTPASPSPAAVQLPGREEEVEVEKKPKNRWSTIPETLKKLTARRRSSAAAHTSPTFEVKVDDTNKLNLTEENLAWYENEVGDARNALKNRLSAIDLIPTPTHSPMDTSHLPSPPQPISSSNQMAPLPLPFAPWADGPPSPAATADRRRSSGQASLSPTKHPIQHRLSSELPPQPRPASLYSHRSSIALPFPHTHRQSSTFSTPASPRTTSRRGTPVPDPTCILCKTSKPSYEFVDRRITPNCWHEPATCLHCMQAWIHHALTTQGIDRCACPECGEAMGSADMAAFVHVAKYTH